MYVVGGLIVGNPDDTRESIEANLAFARAVRGLAVHPASDAVSAHADDRDFRQRGLIVDEDVAHYDGTTAVVRTEHVPADEVEFMRWRAERWMKVRHMPAALLHSPGFVLRHGLSMLRHTFAGTTLRSLLGLEDEHVSFERFREVRRRERTAAVS